MNNNIKNMWKNELINFIENGKENMVEILINNDVIDVESLYFKDNNPLILSLYYNFNLSTIKELIKKGCNINEHNKIGWFPLYVSIEYNSIEYTSYLLENKANINKQYYNEYDIHDKNNGKTVLHITLENYKCYNNIINLLLKYKPNLNIQDYNGNTPLHYLLLSNNNYVNKLIKESIIKKILQIDNNLNIVNIDNKNSLDIANENNINLLELNNEVILLKNKKKLSLYKSYHNRLGLNSNLKIIPIDLIDIIINNSI